MNELINWIFLLNLLFNHWLPHGEGKTPSNVSEKMIKDSKEGKEQEVLSVDKWAKANNEELEGNFFKLEMH